MKLSKYFQPIDEDYYEGWHGCIIRKGEIVSQYCEVEVGEVVICIEPTNIDNEFFTVGLFRYVKVDKSLLKRDKIEDLSHELISEYRDCSSGRSFMCKCEVPRKVVIELVKAILKDSKI